MNTFDGFEVVSTYSDGQACEDGMLVAINPKDRVSRAVWEYLAEHAPKGAKPPNNWPVDLMGWFLAKSADDKALAMSSALIRTHAAAAERIYSENTDGGIFKLFGIYDEAGVLTELSTATSLIACTFWLVPNENGGITLMFPEDY
jgi:hypothetical protein